MAYNLYFHISKSTDPYENLATEKYLFDTLSENDIILYLWQNKDTVVIGKNQNPAAECRISLFEKEGVKLARRLSGGGAVYHDTGNLNFTFLCSEENYSPKTQTEIIMNACSMAGIMTEFSGRNDILAGGRKFSGNAFYISKGKVCRHGTLMINTDTEKLTHLLTPPKAKLEAKGIKSVKSRVVNLSELAPGLSCEEMKNYLISAFEEKYSISANPILNIDTTHIQNLKKEYECDEFIFGKTLPFTADCESYFPWGHIRICLNAKKGKITSVQVYTDCLDADLTPLLQKALSDISFTPDSVDSALKASLQSPFYNDISEFMMKEFF